MDIANYRAKLQRIKQELIAQLPALAETLAVSALSVIKNRSINDGIEVDDEKKDYSTNVFPTSYLVGKERNKAGAAYIQANNLGNWHGFRKAQGLRSEKVNLSYTNRMWTGIHLVKVESQSLGVYQATVGAVDTETREKLAANRALFGDFLQPNDDDIVLARKVVTNKLNRLLA